MKACAVVLHICGPKDIAYFYTTDYSLRKWMWSPDHMFKTFFRHTQAFAPPPNSTKLGIPQVDYFCYDVSCNHISQ